jgi:hypothetical protein
MNRLLSYFGQDTTSAVPATPATTDAVAAAAPTGLIAKIGIPGIIVIGVLAYYLFLKKPEPTPLALRRRNRARKNRRRR